ncbi:hypothetical protein [Streptomyces sp. NPDC055287]
MAISQAGDAGGPVGQDRIEVAEVLADRLERHRRVFPPTFATQDQDPAAEFLRDLLGERLNALFDGSLMDVDLPGGVGDDHAAAGEELQDPPGTGARPAGGQGPDVGLMYGSVGTEPGQQAAGSESPYLLVPALLHRVVPEVVEQHLGSGGEGGQAVQLTDGYAGPVAPGLEQRGLRGVDQVRREWWCGRANESGPVPGLVRRCGLGEGPGPDRQSGRELATEPQLGPRLLPGFGTVVVKVQAAGPAYPVRQRDPEAPAASAISDRVLAPAAAARAERAEAPAVAVAATAVRLGRDDRAATLARTEETGLAQDVGDGALAAGQVVEDFLGDQVLAVGFPDGQGQPEHPAGGPPPRLAEPLLGCLSDSEGLEVVVAGEVPVADAPDMLLGQVPTRAEQQELAVYSRRTQARVIARLGRRDPLPVQPGPRAARIARPTLDWAVDRL